MIRFTTCLYILLGSIGYFLSGCQGETPKNSNHPEISEIQEKVSVDSIKANVKKLASFHTRHTTSDTSSDSIGIGAARRWIHEKFQEYREKSQNRLKIKYDQFVKTESNRIGESGNLVALLPGTQLESKDRGYIVSAHYNSRASDVMDDSTHAPGNDNASGMAAVMELARVMSKYEFDATVIFLAVAGEGQGQSGAKHYARKLKLMNKNVAAMITNDIIGNTIKRDKNSAPDDKIRVFAPGIPADKELSDYHQMLLTTGGENDTPSRQLGRFIHRISETESDLQVDLIYRQDRYLKDGDHLAFWNRGYPAVRFTEPYEDYKHQYQEVRQEKGKQYGDLTEFTDYNYVSKVTRLNAAVLVALANAPAPPRDVTMQVQKFENNAALRWDANNEPDLKGYEIVWRKTHTPFWEGSKFVGDSLNHTIQGLSKDNYLFGVRAVDKFGYKSPVVYPSPAEW